jgi:DNA-binding LacI/PurR family transcriptional regulator
MDLVEKIQKMESVPECTKNDSIVMGVLGAIEEGILIKGDIIPSVNQLSSKLGYARETVVKAYNELKDRGLVNSRKGIGYFIENENTNQKLKIALVMYGFLNFQQSFYNAFRKTLDDNYLIDVFFHHNNLEIYKTILNQINGKYGFYVIAPIQNVDDAEKYLETFLSDRLVIVDRFQYISNQVSYVAQEFGKNLSIVLESLLERINEFERLVLFFNNYSDYPIEILLSFQKFCRIHNIRNEIFEEYDEAYIKKNTVYLTIGDNDLWELLKECKLKGYVLGKEIGVLSHNDSIEKEIIEGGITTFSTDFKYMGKLTAEIIKNRKPNQMILPNILIRRNSL